MIEPFLRSLEVNNMQFLTANGVLMLIELNNEATPPYYLKQPDPSYYIQALMVEKNIKEKDFKDFMFTLQTLLSLLPKEKHFGKFTIFKEEDRIRIKHFPNRQLK